MRVCVPAVSAPVAEGVLVKAVAVMVFAPLVRVRAVDGSVIA